MVGCESYDDAPSSLVESSDASSVLFEDSMTGDWEKNWFLDGATAIVTHEDDGLLFHSPSSGVSPVDKNKFRKKFDSHHAVLWTRQEFEGDIRISFELTRLEVDWANLIYIHAQGIGTPPYTEDIYEWKELREVASMDKYFRYMNLMSLSLRGEIRCRRYPWFDVSKDLKYDDNLVEPMVPHEGLPAGKTYSVVIVKRKDTCTLRIREVDSDAFIIDYTWDLTDYSPARQVPYVEKGRIGLRQMGGNKALYRNFKVERLSDIK